MTTPEERRRRTEVQRAKRSAARICGWCKSPADYGLVQWYVSGDRYKHIAFCHSCHKRLEAPKRIRRFLRPARVDSGSAESAAPGERRLTDRQRRNLEQKAKRAVALVCGWCRAPATHDVIPWFGTSERHQQIAICVDSYSKLEGPCGIRPPAK